MKRLISIVLLSVTIFPVLAVTKKTVKKAAPKTQKIKKMKVDIWSDVMCPFCYIGKRQFEKALSHFPYKDSVEIVWHSFQLDPEMKSDGSKDVYTYLAERKGQTRDWSVKMHENVVNMAKNEGLHYRFDIAKVANSFDAHRLGHFAKSKNKGNEMEEALFKAYFTEGAMISDHHTLAKLASTIGLDSNEVLKMLATDQFTKEVHADIDTAEKIGVSGVPFFVFDNKYAVSGAQGSETFSKALNHLYQEIQANQKTVCKPGEECK